MCISISQIGLISKIPGLAKHELLNVQKIYQSSQVFNSFVFKFYCVILNTYKLNFAKYICTPPPLKSTFPGWASGKFVLSCCPRRRQCWVEEVRWEECLWHRQDRSNVAHMYQVSAALGVMLAEMDRRSQRADGIASVLLTKKPHEFGTPLVL